LLLSISIPDRLLIHGSLLLMSIPVASPLIASQSIASHPITFQKDYSR